MNPIPCGLAGFGSFGRLHARAIAAAPGAELVAVCTSSPSSAAAAGKELGVPAFSDLASFLREGQMDVVHVVVPNHLHERVALAALQAGKHVLLEKPVALSEEGCERLRSAARRSGLVVGVDHELHMAPLWRRVKGLIADGAVGDVMSVAVHLWRGSFRAGREGWRYDPRFVGDWIFEEPIHLFDLARWLVAADPVGVTCRGTSSQEGSAELVDNLASLFDLPDGRFALVTHTLRGHGHELAAEVVGSEGTLRARWQGESDRSERQEVSLEHWDGRSLHRIEVPPSPGEIYELGLLIQNLMAAVRGGGNPVVTLDDGIWAVAMCEAAMASVRAGGEQTPVRSGLDMRDRSAH